jgi:hypothetical protein
MHDPEKLRELASWYREFAERAGNPAIWWRVGCVWPKTSKGKLSLLSGPLAADSVERLEQ